MTQDSQNKMREKAKELLSTGKVKCVIGWTVGSTADRTTPAFVLKPEDVDSLVWNDKCRNNLAIYLTRKEIKQLGPVAIIAKGCDIKAIVVLIQESQLKREDIHIIGMECSGVEGISCGGCTVRSPKYCDTLIETEVDIDGAASNSPEADEISSMDDAARWEFWQNEFSRCIKCYACRSACPMCYCTRCIAQKSQPQWISPSQHGQGNFSWNVIRAMHLAGRCVECGACERACPMGIKIGLINKKLARVVKDNFNYEAGRDAGEPPLTASYKVEDKEKFIK